MSHVHTVRLILASSSNLLEIGNANYKHWLILSNKAVTIGD